MGFSQGATMLLYLAVRGLLKTKCVLISPYFYPEYDETLQGQELDAIEQGSAENLFTCTYGTQDQVIPMKCYQRMKEKYPYCVYHEHDGGHFVNCAGD